MFARLPELVSNASLGAAAAVLTVHHSTLQERPKYAERALGWTLRDVTGLTRLNVVLTLRRLHRNGVTAAGSR